jgi:hypothetical protein
LWASKGDEHAARQLTTTAGIVQPLLSCLAVLILVPLISRPWMTPRLMWICNGVMLATWTLTAVIRNAGLQYLTIFVFGFFRAAFYVVYYETARIYFPSRWFGRASTGTYTIAGILTILTGLFVNKHAIENQAYRAVNLGIGGIALAANIALIFMCTKPTPLVQAITSINASKDELESPSTPERRNSGTPLLN